MTRLRTLVVVLGDQLDLENAAFDGFDPTQDAVWRAEAEQASTHVGSSKQRIALFLAAMRQFAQALWAAGRPNCRLKPQAAGISPADHEVRRQAVVCPGEGVCAVAHVPSSGRQVSGHSERSRIARFGSALGRACSFRSVARATNIR